MVNKVILVGNVGKDPEVRHLESGSVLARFSLATNESYKDKNGEWQQVTEWHNITAWRGLAERAEKSVRKGTMLYLEGKLTTRKWQDNNGNDRYTTEVVANTYRILNRNENNQGGNESSYGLPTGQNDFPTVSEPQPAKTSAPPSDLEDDLPF